MDGKVADSELYKALVELARAANKWSQFKRNLPPDGGKKVLKELATRHSDLAHSLKTGLNSHTLRFLAIVTPPGAQVSSRRAPVVQPRRLSKTSKLENLLLSDLSRVKVFRKIIDHQSGKPFYKLTKFKIVRVTDHTYVTDNGKVYRKNQICLKPNYRSTVLVAPNTIGDRIQASNSISRGTVKRPVKRSQPVLLEQRPNNPPRSTPMVDLTVDSSSESSIGSNNGRQVAQDSAPIGKRQRFQCYSPPVRFVPQFSSTSTPHASTYAAYSRMLILLNNLKGRSLRLNRRLHIVLLLPRPLILLGLLRCVPLVLKLLSRRLKKSRHSIWVSLLIQRPQSCVPPTLCFLYLLNQWLTMQSQSGRHIEVKSLPNFLAIRCGIR